MNNKLSAIEIVFAAPVDLPDGFDRALAALIGMVCEQYQRDNPTRVMWTASFGAKPRWSRSDAQFLRASSDPDAIGPLDGEEPRFDDTVYQIECDERADYYGQNPANPDRERLRRESTEKHTAARVEARKRSALTDEDIGAALKSAGVKTNDHDPHYYRIARAVEAAARRKAKIGS